MKKLTKKTTDKVKPLREAYAESKALVECLQGLMNDQEAELDQLRDQVVEIGRASEAKSLLYEDRLKKNDEEHQRQVRQIRDRAVAPFTRRDLEGMPPVQLRSLAEESIAECRRREMVEAEGLVEKLRTNLRQTNLETVQGLARAYAEEVVARQKQMAEEKRRAEQRLQQYDSPLYETIKKDLPRTDIWGRPQPTSITKCWCEKPLIRGQCTTHTRDWNGSERCTCGRSFQFCKQVFHGGRNTTGHTPNLVPESPLPRESRR